MRTFLIAAALAIAALPAAAQLSTDECLACHDTVHAEKFKASVHAPLDCTGCHADITAVPHEPAPAKVDCASCHTEAVEAWNHSLHAKAAASGRGNGPQCKDCHGPAHEIQPMQRAKIPQICSSCHGQKFVMQKAGLSTQPVSSYQSSYHGLARQLGSTTAADCASCHGAHDILPSSDPRSAIHPSNLQKTCGKCHQGAKANFARGKIHISAGETDDTGSLINTWIRRIYITLIALTIGFMILHNLLIWWRKAQAARRASGRTLVRMNLNQRIQHFILVISFVVLVISGFALAWPDSLFARICGPETIRRLIHRIAAVVMIILGLYHLGYMTLTREGRRGLRDFWFRFSDAKDLVAVLRNRKTQAGRFTYAEKAEYWAGLWGTIVMAITGLMIWYSVDVATWIPRWWIDIATTIHYYEAILATLAIIVWHIYHVIFDPDVYPMNWAWFDGKVSEEEFEKEHPLAHETVQHETTTEGDE